MPHREAGEEFLSFLKSRINTELKSQINAREYVTVNQDRTGTSISYDITPPINMAPNKWKNLYDELYSEAYKIAKQVNERKQPPPDKVVRARVFGSPLGTYKSELTQFSRETATPVTVSFSIPYFPKIK